MGHALCQIYPAFCEMTSLTFVLSLNSKRLRRGYEGRPEATGASWMIRPRVGTEAVGGDLVSGKEA